MKVLYLTTWDFKEGESDGVYKKIQSQIRCFEKRGYQVDVIYLHNQNILFRRDGKTKKIGHVGKIEKTPAYIKILPKVKKLQYDWVYNRYGMMDTFYYHVLRRLHKNGSRIMVEIPTYPYIYEKPKGILYDILFGWDRFYVNRLHKVIDFIVTYSQDEVIYGVKTIHIMNGIDYDRISKTKENVNRDNIIDLLAVALMQPYHGYERLLYGIRQYYDQGGKREFRLHLVGDGPEKKHYEEIVKEQHLEKWVTFYGKKSGLELDELYEQADIGVCTLGGYKRNVEWSSELKSKEYLAKNLPILAGVDIDVFEKLDKKYFLRIPNDSSEVDMQRVARFYDDIYGDGRKKMDISLRDAAEPYINMISALKPVYKKLEEI